MGLLLPEPKNRDVVQRLFANGVLAAGGRPHVVQLRPPLTLSTAEADEIIAIVRKSAAEALGS
jgi:4-aminobutyrate aminotransferase-like enzyme